MLAVAQLSALCGAAARELGWGLRAVRREHARWTRHAAALADAEQRRHALAALADKRPLLDGAALFWIIPDQRDLGLLRTLVAFQVLANFHDHASERAAGRLAQAGVSGSSMTTFVQAVDVRRPAEGYRQDPYLSTLVAGCRRGCAALPRFDAAREHLIDATRRGRSLDLEHIPEDARRVAALRSFAGGEPGRRRDLTWFEFTAGTSSMLTAIVCLALAGRPDATARDLSDAVEAYTLVATLSALLDNYVDLADDLDANNHNYLAYYIDVDRATVRVASLIDQGLILAGGLRHGARHRVIVAAMVAMYLTADGACEPDRSTTTCRLAEGGGSLVAILLPILAMWRKARGDGSS